MKKREAAFTLLFRHWLRENPLGYSAAFELKQTQTDSLPFSAVEEHQLDALLAAEYGQKGLIYKAPDDSRGVKPFDLFYLHHAPAYVVIRYPHCFVLILVKIFQHEAKASVRKSLTEKRAREIATCVVKV